MSLDQERSHGEKNRAPPGKTQAVLRSAKAIQQDYQGGVARPAKNWRRSGKDPMSRRKRARRASPAKEVWEWWAGELPQRVWRGKGYLRLKSEDGRSSQVDRLSEASGLVKP